MKSLRKAAARPKTSLRKADPTTTALFVLGSRMIAIKAKTEFSNRSFGNDMKLKMPELEPGADYAVLVTLKSITIEKLTAGVIEKDCLGGFHFAPGGNAK